MQSSATEGIHYLHGVEDGHVGTVFFDVRLVAQLVHQPLPELNKARRKGKSKRIVKEGLRGAVTWPGSASSAFLPMLRFMTLVGMPCLLKPSPLSTT